MLRLHDDDGIPLQPQLLVVAIAGIDPASLRAILLRSAPCYRMRIRMPCALGGVGAQVGNLSKRET